MTVAVTGIACRTAAGATPAELWDACLGDPSDPPPKSFAGTFAGSPSLTIPFREAPPVDAARMPALAGHLKRATKNMSLALATAFEALGPMVERVRGDERCAVFWGSGSSTIEPIEASYVQLIAGGKTRVNPLTVPQSMASSPASAVAMALGVRGPSFAIASACASSAHAVAMAEQMIRAGMIDRAIVGGSEVLGELGAAISWHSTGVLSKRGCRPFHPDRDGIVLGEGAAALLIERGELAQREGRAPRAWIEGSFHRTGGTDVMSPDRQIITELVDSAVAHAAPSRGMPLVFNAHATGTVVGDEVELAALRTVAARLGSPLVVSATKPVTGHMLSAAGAVEAILAILSLEAGVVPCAARVDADGPIEHLAPIALPGLDRIHSNSFGFGGMNCVLSFRRA